LYVETPCVLIDLDIMNRNIDRMSAIAKRNGITVRPHTKTHKIPEIAKMQLASGAVGITVAKVSEAEVMAENGLKDIFIGYPVIGEAKIKRALALNRKIHLIIGVDSLVGAKMLSDVAQHEGQTVEVRLEVDTGLKRTGIPYSEALSLAREIDQMKGLQLKGIFTFRGLIYKGEPTGDRVKAGHEEGELLVTLAEKLRAEGIDIKDVSLGSTPTSEFAAEIPGVTEIRPGTYVFNDAQEAKLGVCSLDDCAAKVLVTVISIPSKDLAILDGGSKTFATDVNPGVYPAFLEGYGNVELSDNLILERLNEEHGMLKVKQGAPELKVGDRVTVIPNHICSTVNLHNKVYFTQNNIVIREVVVAGRGKLY